MMDVLFLDYGWEDYLYWQQVDKKMVRKINELIKDIRRNPFSGLGKPEPLMFNMSGAWSRRITQEHRLVYGVRGGAVVIMQCRFHYTK